MTRSIKDDSVKNNRQVHMLRRSEPRLARFRHLGVANRWLETPKRAHCSASIAKTDKHMKK